MQPSRVAIVKPPTARSANIALAIVYAGLASIEKQGQAVKIADVIADAHKTLAEGNRHVA